MDELWSDRQFEGQTDRQLKVRHRQTDRQTDRQTVEGQTDS